MKKYILVLTTAGRKEEAEKIAQVLLKKRLAGCVQIVGPLTSIYWWKKKREVAREWLCLIKSKKVLYRDLERAIKKVHSYVVPEVVAIPIVAASKDYLKWLHDELKK